MSTHKKIDILCIAAVLAAALLAVLFMNGKALGMIPAISQESVSDFFTANDLNADWNTSSATKIQLSDQGSTINGNGAYVYDGNVYIAYAGHYVLTGGLTNGSVIINAGKTDKIWISLDEVTIHCDDDAAIRVEQADKVFLTLADGTENSISSGAQYNDQVIASGVDGTIYSRDDLTINGPGSLAVDAAYQHGIVCNDDLVIAGGDITINAVQDGIHANDSVCIRNAVLSISAGDDGITVSNDDETAFLYVESGSITIPSCYEGLEAIDITIAGGTIHITSTDDGINANGQGDKSVIRITDGDITILNPSGRDADGLDSNGSIYIEGGSVFISVTDGGNYALDYGIENGGECIVSGGTVIACGSSGMAEGFDTGSPQGFLMYNTSAAAGTTVTLADSDGRQLLSQEIPYSFSSVVISTPDLKIGDICTIEIDGVQEQITIDNVSTSGFVPAGRFGGGMRNGMDSGRDPGNQENRGGQDFTGRQGREESSDDMEFPGNMEPPDDMEFPGNMEPPGGAEFPGNAEPPGGAEFPGNMEPPGGAEFPGNMEPPGGADFPDSAEFPDELELPANADSSKGAGMHSERQWQDTQKAETADKRLYAPDSSNTSSDKLILLGISISVLLLGLLVAIKIKH